MCPSAKGPAGPKSANPRWAANLTEPRSLSARRVRPNREPVAGGLGGVEPITQAMAVKVSRQPATFEATAPYYSIGAQFQLCFRRPAMP
jgi:hypothetical protein